MTPTPDVQERIRRYLLGQLTDSAREKFEQELLVDDELFEELLVVEDELNDDYLEGELPRRERVQFEQHFLAAPERQEKLRFARALNRYVTVASQKERTVANVLPVSRSNRMLFRAAAAFAVVVLIAATLLFLSNRNSSPKSFATLNLTISQATRGDGTPPAKVSLTHGEDALKIILRLPDQSPAAARYRVELESENGGNRSLDPISQDGQTVTVVIPAGELKRGLYSLKLFTVRTDGGEQRINGNYLFAVE